MPTEVQWRCPIPGCVATKRRYPAYLKHCRDAHGIYAPIFTRLEPGTDIEHLDEQVTRIICEMPEEDDGDAE